MDGQQMKEMVTIVKKNPEEKLYLICIKGLIGNGDSWDIVEGREEAYVYIKDKIMYESISLTESFILVETLKLPQRKTIYQFMKHMENFFNDPEFDIDDYVAGENPTDEASSEMQNEMLDAMKNSIRMEDMLSGGYNIKEI